MAVPTLMRASISIGGSLPESKLAQLYHAVLEERAYIHDRYDTLGTGFKVFRRMIKERDNTTPLVLAANQADFGELELIEDFCRLEGLIYQRSSEGQINPLCNKNGVCVTYHPDWKHPMSVTLDAHGYRVIALADLRDYDMEGLSLKDVLAQQQAMIIEIPPFVLVPD